MQIITIASGKGGVGKSMVAVNLSLALGRLGYVTLLADFDLGGSNLSLLLGIRGIKQGIGTFLYNETSNLADIIIDTPYENVHFIPGDSEMPGLANITVRQKKRLIYALYKCITYDFIIIDLGAGTSTITLDLFLMTNTGIIVGSPTSTSIVNAYLLIKNLLYRLVQLSCKRGSAGAEYIKKIMHDDTPETKQYMSVFFEKLQIIDPEAHNRFMKHVENFHPYFILNMLHTARDGDKALQLKRIVQQYVHISLYHLGVISHDIEQDIALQAQIPIVHYKPENIISQGIFRIADKIVEHIHRHAQADSYNNEQENSFIFAEYEADADYEYKVQAIYELLNSNALTMEDLIEIVKSQQMELHFLRKNNMLYKQKLSRIMKMQAND